MRYVPIIVSLLLIIIAGCTREDEAAFNNSDTGYLALLPQEAHIIGALNLAEMQDTEIFGLLRKYADRTPFRSEAYRKFVEETGFDMEQDLHQIYFAATGPDNMAAPQGIFVANGDFAPEKIAAFLERQSTDPDKFTPGSYGPFRLYRMGDEHLAYCFVNDQTLIGGRDTLVMSALDRFGRQNILSSDLEKNLGSIRFKSQTWIWMNTEQLLASLPVSELGDRLRSLETIRSGQMSMHLSDKIIFDGTCICADEMNAGIIRDMIRGAVAAVKLNFSDDRKAVDIINQLNVENDDCLVKIDFVMSGDEVKYLLEKKGLIARRQ